MVKSSLFGKIKPIKVLAIGDLMLDVYTHGDVSRISPEAPVPVFHVKSRDQKLGGAGNVLLNLKALGCMCYAMGTVGDDRSGKTLLKQFAKEGVITDGIFVLENVPTPVKNRMIASSQQVLRIDEEEVCTIDQSTESKLINYFDQILPNIDVIAISDYKKGLLTRNLLEYIISNANKRGIPTLVDPKQEDFSYYKNATLITPNLKEALLASNMKKSSSLDAVAKKLLVDSLAENLIITRSADGISLFEKTKRSDFAVHHKDVIDVTGAGDTVLAILALCMGNKLPLDFGVELANIAAGLAIEKLGCAAITLPEIASELLIKDSKVFDEDHLPLLKQALLGKKFSILSVSMGISLNSSFYHSIEALKQSNNMLLLHLEEKVDSSFVSMVSSFSFVDFVVISSKSNQSLSAMLEAEKSCIFQDNKLISLQKLLVTSKNRSSIS